MGFAAVRVVEIFTTVNSDNGVNTGDATSTTANNKNKPCWTGFMSTHTE